MVSRFALLLASIAASAILTVALAAAGFAPAPSAPPEASGAATPAELIQAAVPDPTPAATTQVDTVYVKPAPSPKTIRIVRTAPSKAPVVVQRVVRSSEGAEHGEHESEEGED